MRSPIRVHDLAQDDISVLSAGIRVGATGFRMQSELLPSACMVELPSKPHSGMSASVGGMVKRLNLGLCRVSWEPAYSRPAKCIQVCIWSWDS